MDLQMTSSDDPAALRAIIAQLTADAAEKAAASAEREAEVAALKAQVIEYKQANDAADDEIKRLTEIIQAFKRHMFGQRAERIDPEQYELVLDELVTALSVAQAKLEAIVPPSEESCERRRRVNRGRLPAHLERIEQIVDIDDKQCGCCGGDLHVIDEDVTERLDVVPSVFRVLVTRRPRYGCRGCDQCGVVQAPAPSFIVDQGIPTDRLVAHVVVNRFADHQPLYRQAQSYARQGVELDRSTLCDWVGRVAWYLTPLRNHILASLRSSTKLFADETVMPVLAPKTGNTKRGQLWAYARDDRPWGGELPPAVAYMYATNRGSDRPIEHLAGFAGVLQVDGYAGYNRIGGGNAVTLALCLSHARRKFYDFRDKEPVAVEILRRLGVIYKVDDTLRGLPPEDRLATRRELMAPAMAELREYLVSKRGRFSAKGKMAEGINYMLDRWDGLTRFLHDGRIELDTNVVERSIRPIALSRKNSLFAGSDDGAEHWAIIASLIETCKLNGVDPLAWMTATLTKLANGHSSKDLEALMPWHFERRPARLH
jgi:transposase